MPVFSSNDASNPASALTPTQRRVFGCLAFGCIVPIALMPTLRPVTLPLAIQLAFLTALAFLHWHWLKGSLVVPVVSLVTFLSAVIATFAFAA